MNEYAHIIYQKTARILTVGCGLLFAIFSFVYLYVFQRDSLEALHYSLAQGRTHFAPMASALVITLILILLRWGINSLLGLKGKVRTLSYLPSFFILWALTDISHDVYLSSSVSPWHWLLPLLILLFVLPAFWLRKIFRAELNVEGSLIGLVNSNVGILFLLCLLTVFIGNTNRSFHHELSAEHALLTRNYNQAVKVGYRSLEATRTLTALRALALSHTGQMGDKLFEYPQYYHSEGLFFDDDSLSVLRYTNDSVYQHLGSRPYNGEDHLSFLRRICYKESGKFTALDYYLSALLLEKDVNEFAATLKDLYEPADTLPRYYKEALAIYADRYQTDDLAGKVDSLLITRYQDYKEKKKQFTSPTEERNRMRREYGDTYWWYFDYQH